MRIQYLVIGKKRTKAVISSKNYRGAAAGFRRRIKREGTHLVLSLSDLRETLDQMEVVRKIGGMRRMA